MRKSYSRERLQSPWVRWIGMLCIALVLMAGMIQVLHTHPAGQVDHEGCSLCNTAHHVVKGVALVTLAVSILPVWRVASDKPIERPRQKVLHKLVNRPPPVSLISA